MKWEEASGKARKAWEGDIKIDDGSYYREHIKSILDKKDLLLESVERFGSPQYILDEAELREDALRFIKTFRKYIPNSEFFYAFKCNDFPFLLKALKGAGYNADVASLFELKLALKLGFGKIFFTGPGKDHEELKLAVENSDKVILNIDNFDELDDLIGMLKNKDGLKINISIRLNPHDSVMGEWSKFGIGLEELNKAADRIRRHPQLKLKGFHFHCSWNCMPDKYVENIKIIGKFLENNFSDKELSELEFINIGGGFYPEGNAVLMKETDKGKIGGIIGAYNELDSDPHGIVIENAAPLDKFAEKISMAFKERIFPVAPHLKICLEPGRFIAMRSTAILLKVISVKNNGVIADGGANLVGDFRFSEYSFAPIINLSEPSFTLNKKTIYGPLCHPSDLWGYSFFGKDIRKGDVLAVLNQGDYTFSYASRFIKPIAPYVVLSGKNRLVLGKEKEKFEERYFGCKF